MSSMKRKPDVLWILVALFGLGVITTGYTEHLLADRGEYYSPTVERQAG